MAGCFHLCPILVVRLCTALLVLAAGIILGAATGSHAALCNSGLGQLAQGFSSRAYADCSVWTGLHTFSEWMLWLGVIGTVGLGIMFLAAAHKGQHR